VGGDRDGGIRLPPVAAVHEHPPRTGVPHEAVAGLLPKQGRPIVELLPNDGSPFVMHDAFPSKALSAGVALPIGHPAGGRCARSGAAPNALAR
jgi:hypothetical protein